MANKKILWGMLAVLLTFGMAFTGCENGAQEVEGKVGLTYEKAPQVGSVTVTKTENKKYYIVSWDAVAEDVRYDLYFQQNGKKSSSSFGSTQNQYKYDPQTGAESPNDDFDKWSVRVSSLGTLTPGSYRFGIRTSRSASTVASTSSDVRWADPITVTPGPKAASVTATAGKSNNDDVVVTTWTAVTGAIGYEVSIEWDNYVVDSTTTTGTTYTYTVSSYYGEGSYRVSVTPIITTVDISVLPSVEVWSNTVVIQ